MPVVRAGPNQFLVVGRRGALQNRGSAVQAFLMPGTSYVLVPSTKQEASFEFTQETKDGIPLRFKGIVIYRITDPVPAASLFDFDGVDGVARITSLLTHICLGELRHVVSHMTMVECIEQRKTTLSEVAATALRQAAGGEAGQASDWGVKIEVAQVAQVFIVDAQLRQQLEAEVRNDIRRKAEQSNIRSQEEIQLTQMDSENRVQEKALGDDKDTLRCDQEKFHAQLEIERDRANSEAPVRLLKIARESAVLRQELAMRELRNQAHTLEVEGDLLLDRARQAMRREMLPLEQAPQVVAAASKVLQGANLSLYGENTQILGQLAPIFELVTRAVRQATEAGAQQAAAPDETP